MEVIDFVTNETYTAMFSCQAIGEPVPNISWYFNGTMINESDNSKYNVTPIPVNLNATQSTLSIFNAASNDVGTYVCEATNEVGSTRSSAALTINGKQKLLFSVVVD